MELKHGTVRLDAAAEWLSKTTGRTFTAADLIDAHDKLPICALIPRSKANPKYSGPVQRAMLAKAVEVEIDAEAARKGPLTQKEIAEAAKRRLSEGIATRLEIEKTIHEEGIYLLSRRDLHLLARHGVQRLNRGTPFLSLVASRGFQPGLAEAIEFGTPVDVTADMLCVLKGYLVKFAEQVAAQQVETPAPIPDRVREQREPSEAAQADPAIDQGNEIIDTGGFVGWQRALFECWPQISAAFPGKTSARNAVSWLKKSGPRDVIPKEQSLIESMEWIGSDGATHTVSIKTVQNVISAWKKAGKVSV